MPSPDKLLPTREMPSLEDLEVDVKSHDSSSEIWGWGLQTEGDKMCSEQAPTFDDGSSACSEQAPTFDDDSSVSSDATTLEEERTAVGALFGERGENDRLSGSGQH